MLTLANVNTTQAKTYYKRENYYSQEDAQANSQWQGQGAAQFDLHGAIEDLDAYENIVNGLSPDGKTQLRQKQKHQDKKEDVCYLSYDCCSHCPATKGPCCECL